jgi:hypothetical protein
VFDCFKKYVIFQIYILWICSQNQAIKPLVEQYCDNAIKGLQTNTHDNDLSLAIKALTKPNLNLYAELNLPLSFDYKQTNINWDFWIKESDNMRMQGRYYEKEGYIAVTKPYYYNWKTSIQIGAYKNGILTQIGTVSSGLTDELREEFSINGQKYIGHVLTCNCMEITKDSLRHPIFKGFREDKDPKKCRWEDIFK